MKEADLILIIDMQNVYREGQPWACRDFDGTARRIREIVSHAEMKCANPNVFVTEFLPPESPFGTWCDYNTEYAEQNADAWLNAVADEIRLLTQRCPLISKDTYSAMSIEVIRKEAMAAQERGGRVVVTGVVAECCVLWTACAAIDLGCKVVYITDAVSGFDVAKEKGAEFMLQGLAPMQVELMITKEYLKEVSKNRPWKR